MWISEEKIFFIQKLHHTSDGVFYNIGNCARSGAILLVQKKFSLCKNARKSGIL